MHFLHKKRGRTPAVIIVSLIDVLLVVLIFLMVTTTAKKMEPSFKLNLPNSKESKPGASQDKPFVVQVATNFPFFFVGERATTLDNLQIELANAVKKEPNLKVTVRADRLAPFGEIVKLIDATKAAQVGSLNFVTEKPGGK
ncbi:MAG: biopolymer transport protein ExbD [Verrucomicrobiota bacterium]|jgi:biopolymer transport protein ExbD